LHQVCAADAELSLLVECGLSKNPADRFATMGLMGKALAAWLSEQGVTEDACGVSLDARWLSRSTDPTALGRVSRSSTPDGWPEPPSGVRTVSSKFGNAPTVPLAKPAGTPYSLVSSSTALPARQRHWLLGGAALAVVVALLLAYFGIVRASGPASARVPATAQRPQAESPLPEQLIKPAAGEATEHERALGPPPGAASTAPVTELKPSPPKLALPKATPKEPPPPVEPAANAPAPPKSDLLAPY
jgi:hypothetical protein